MRILEENENRDLFAGSNNQLGILVDIDATEQACKSAIEAQRGEMQYDTTRGIPTNQTIWTGIPDQQRFQFYCIEALRAVEGVQAIPQFNTEILDNQLFYEAVIGTIFGEVSISGALISAV
jgi:hypothetical protein